MDNNKISKGCKCEISEESKIPYCKDCIKKVTEAFNKLSKFVTEQLFPTLKNYMNTLWNGFLHAYPNKRIVWLAFHHPKKRIRKKNKHRIEKWLKNNIKRGEQKDNGY